MATLSLKTRSLLALGVVLVPAFVAIALVQSGPKAYFLEYQQNVQDSLAARDLDAHLGDAHTVGAELLAASDSDQTQQLTNQLLGQAMPAVDLGISTLRTLEADDTKTQHERLTSIAAEWQQMKALWASPGGLGPVDGSARTAKLDQLQGLFGTMESQAEAFASTEDIEASQSYRNALHEYEVSLWLMRGLLFGALLLCAAVILWLVRGILPRTLAYSRFAERIAEGDYANQPEVKGRDEIGLLGRTLSAMATRQAAAHEYETTQIEFSENLQMTESEGEAHELVKRHLERSIPGSDVTVLNRNNSADRLEAKTALRPDSPLRQTLQGAEPRSCLAIRLSRSHREMPGTNLLLPCGICGECPGSSTCTPLLVGGEVIGSVLVNGAQPLDGAEERRLRETVSQAAPVLANLRNLAIAQLRAATDALTGLANRRALDHTMKRMVALASRTLSPLSAVLFDLDLFKQLNDSYGHGHGDEVLAAVGAALRATLRESDFAGRYGGEEFLVLLPATGVDGAKVLANKIRHVVSEIFVPGVERKITISCGIATIPDHAADADSLVRCADRALYAAKANGRDRLEVALVGGEAGEPIRAPV